VTEVVSSVPSLKSKPITKRVYRTGCGLKLESIGSAREMVFSEGSDYRNLGEVIVKLIFGAEMPCAP